MLLLHSELRRRLFIANNPYDHVDPALSEWLHNERRHQRTTATIIAYLAPIRRFIAFCTRYNYSIFNVPYDPKLMQYWVASECRRVNNAASLTSWESAIKYFSLCITNKSNDQWYKHPQYRTFRRRIRFRYQLPPTEKLPFTLQHLVNYTRARNVTPETYWTAPYDDIVEITWLQLLFTTLSRPCELLKSPGNATKRGLRYSDFRYRRPGKARYWRLMVLHYKNQRARRVPKELTISDTRCSHGKRSNGTHCNCYYINPYHLFYVLLKRREQLYRRPNLSRRQLRNLNTTADDHIFVRSTGEIMTTRNTNDVIRDMARTLGVLEPEKYSEYSLRVGGATHCTAAGIPDGLMYRYVGWDPSRLPDSGRRYVRPPLELRLRFPYFLLHGFVNEFNKQHPVTVVPGLFHDPWAVSDPDALRPY